MSNDELIKTSGVWFDYIIEAHPSFTGCLVDGKGVKRWFVDGQRHRENGPAVEWPDGTKFWFINGVQYTEREHKPQVRHIKLKMLIDMDQHSL